MDLIRLSPDRDMYRSGLVKPRNTMTENSTTENNSTTESLFSHPAETEVDATSKNDSAAPVAMPVFSHLGK